MTDKYEIPFYCQVCGEAWPSKRSRSRHMVAKHTPGVQVGRKPGPEPELGTDKHYQWCLRNNYIPPSVDKLAHADYQRMYYAKKQRGVR